MAESNKTHLLKGMQDTLLRFNKKKSNKSTSKKFKLDTRLQTLHDECVAVIVPKFPPDSLEEVEQLNLYIVQLQRIHLDFTNAAEELSLPVYIGDPQMRDLDAWRMHYQQVVSVHFPGEFKATRGFYRPDCIPKPKPGEDADYRDLFPVDVRVSTLLGYAAQHPSLWKQPDGSHLLSTGTGHAMGMAGKKVYLHDHTRVTLYPHEDEEGEFSEVTYHFLKNTLLEFPEDYKYAAKFDRSVLIL